MISVSSARLLRAWQNSRMQQAFPFVDRVRYEGPATRNPFAFRHYDPDATVAGKPMRDHLRFAACYWHTMRNGLGDPFGAPTAVMPWDDGTDAVTNCLRRADAFFEFLEKCSIDRFCFHDRDVAPELATLRESNAALDRVGAAVNGWRVRPLGSEGYRTAEVTLGGVDTRALDARTMEVQAVPGLHFIGEVVDVTGWLGGYNFQWAWSSGWAAGQHC